MKGEHSKRDLVVESAHAEIVDEAGQDVTRSVSHPLDTPNDFQSRLLATLQSRERRAIVARCRAERADKVLDLTVRRLHEETTSRIQEVELSAEQIRTSILAAHNQRMGDLKQQQVRLAAQAMVNGALAEGRDQADLQRRELLEEDREMLSVLFKARTLESNRRIALEHGLADSLPTPVE